MSEYGCGVSLTQAFNYDKERLLKALDGQLLCGETEEGFEYCDAPEEECRAFIISVFDNAVYHALQGYASGRVMENVMNANGLKTTDGQLFQDYLHFKMEDDIKQLDEEQYHYGDPNNPDDLEDVEE